MPKYPKNHKDVEYRVPGRKSRVAGSTKATSDFLAAVHEEHPAATIAELRAIITAHIKAGYGGQIPDWR